jgi:phosphopantothenoylcysteine decarboxylase/phosphopantothenate--cysteine ligase
MSSFNPLVLLGISGGIAAYKAAEIVRGLKKAGLDVRVVMTENAARFVAPLTFQALSGHAVGINLWDDSEWGMGHIDRAREADLFLIAPATADVLARLAAGMADDLLTTAVLATDAPLWVAPSMNPAMFAHPATQANLRTLQDRGARILEPGVGEMACGDVGPGRLPEPSDIIAAVLNHFSKTKDMEGLRVLVTAGPTREFVDPVRFISNPSTGKMGFALAEAAAERGASVVLVSGPSDLPNPPGVERVNVVSVFEMRDAALPRFPETDLVIAAAAVSDYTLVERAPQKLKKSSDEMILRLKKTPDFLVEMGQQKRKDQLLVGFAAETEDHEANALKKLRAKNLDMIVLNDLTQPGAGFAGDTNRVLILDVYGGRVEFPLMSKREVANHILNQVQHLRVGK